MYCLGLASGGRVRLSRKVGRYIEGLRVGQGRHAGELMRLLGWQRRFLQGAFSRPGDAALSMARGNGKTCFCAAIACAAVDVGGPLVEPMAECLVIASSFDQGLIAFRHILHFLKPSFTRYGVGPGGRFRVADSSNRATITDRETGALLRVLGSDPRRLHGAAPKLLLLDEVAQWPPERVAPMLAALRTSRGKIAESRALWLGTRPAADEHPFQRALDGHGVGFRLSYAAPKDADPFKVRTWRRANPSLSFMPDLREKIQEEAHDARRDPVALASFRALRLNQGVSDTVSSVLIDSETWKAAMGLPAPGQRSPDYVLGVDLGQNAAMSAAAAYFRTCELEAVAVFPELPDLAERGLGDGVGGLYREMADRGELIQSGRRVSDVGELMRECLRRWGRPVAIVCDRWRVAELRQALEAVRFPLSALVERGQGFKDGGADVREFRAALLAEEVRPASSLLLAAAVSEARTAGDPAGNHKLAKRGEGGRRAQARDDAAAAAILAVATGRRRWGAGAATRPRWRYRGAV